MSGAAHVVPNLLVSSPKCYMMGQKNKCCDGQKLLLPPSVERAIVAKGIIFCLSNYADRVKLVLGEKSGQKNLEKVIPCGFCTTSLSLPLLLRITKMR